MQQEHQEQQELVEVVVLVVEMLHQFLLVVLVVLVLLLFVHDLMRQMPMLQHLLLLDHGLLQQVQHKLNISLSLGVDQVVDLSAVEAVLVDFALVLDLLLRQEHHIQLQSVLVVLL
jgi:hypothetical protein